MFNIQNQDQENHEFSRHVIIPAFPSRAVLIYDGNTTTIMRTFLLHIFTYDRARGEHPQVRQWPSRDYRTYKSPSAHTKVKSHPNPRGSSRPCATWKYKHMLKGMTVPGESNPEEVSEDTDGTDTD